MPTKTEFLSAYRAALPAAYPWAADAAKLHRFMESVETTLGGGNTWNHDSEVAKQAYKAIGGIGRYSLKALRALD